jgi:GTP-binding protein
MNVAVVGRPNVGKSSLVNALLGEERMIVTDVPGTTRDAIDTDFRYHGRDFTLVDTAGLRRKSRVTTGVEYFSSLRAAECLARADVALVVLDASEEISRQDYRIAAMPFTEGVAAVFVFNKWDAVEGKTTLATRDLVRDVARHLPDFEHAESLFVSAKSGQRVSRVMAAAIRAYDSARRQIPDEETNAFIDRVIGGRSHPYVRGKMMKFWGMRQVGVAPPAFIVYCNRPGDVAENYRRYIVNRVRETFGFVGSPLRIVFRRR